MIAEKYLAYIENVTHNKIRTYSIIKDGTCKSGAIAIKMVCDDGVYFAKFSIAQINRIKSIHDLFFSTPKLPIVQPLFFSDRSVDVFENYVFELYPYIEHEKFTDFDLQPLTFVSIMKLLAKFHSCVSSQYSFNNAFIRSAELFKMDTQIEKRVEDMQHHGISSIFWSNLLDFYRYKKYLDLDPIFIHGDVHFNNFLYQQNQAIKMIDYELCCVDTFYFDLSRALFYCCFFDKKIKMKECDKDLFLYLLKKYRRNVQFNVDCDLLNIYIVATLLKFPYSLDTLQKVINDYCLAFNID